MFKHVTEAKIVGKDDAVSLVYLPPEAPPESEADRMLGVLGTVSRVLNVGDDDAAEKEFRGLAALHP